MIVTKIYEYFISRMLHWKWKGGFSWQIGEPSSLPGKVTKSQLTNLVKTSLDAWARIAKLQFQHKTNNLPKIGKPSTVGLVSEILQKD